MATRNYLVVAHLFSHTIYEGGNMRLSRTINALKPHINLFSLSIFKKNLFFSNLISAPWALTRLWWHLRNSSNLWVLFFYHDLPLNPCSRIQGLCWVVFQYIRLLKNTTKQRGHYLVLDVADLPREQSKTFGTRLYITDRGVTAFEKKLFPLFDELWFSSRPMAEYEERLMEYPFVSKLKILPNSAPNFLNSIPRNLSGTAKRLVYAGTMNHERGLPLLLDVVQSFQGKIELHLCGQGGGWIERQYRNIPYIKYWGSLDEKEAASLAKSCHLGVIPHPRGPYLDITSNSKLAFYVMTGLPVLAVLGTLSAKIIDQYKIGMVFEYNRESFRRAILQALDPLTYEDLLKNVTHSQTNFETNNVYNVVR